MCVMRTFTTVLMQYTRIYAHSSPACLYGNGLRFLHSAAVLNTKNYDPKWRKLRGKKVIKITLPDYDEVRNDEKLSLEEMRSKLKEKGIVPMRQWTEKPIIVTHSGLIIDKYIPPEGDGKVSLISKSGMVQRFDHLLKQGKTYRALRKIRNFEYDFDVPSFANNAHKIYMEAHEALNKKDEDKLHELVTEKCYVDMMDNMGNVTVRWKFVQSLEQPRMVHLRTSDMMKTQTYAQATVRFHTQQILAIYDRFGRLMHGSEDKVKDVLEYAVFEKPLTGMYATWRLHAKIIPDWIPPREPVLRTFRKPKMPEETTDEPKVDKATVVDDAQVATPAVA